MRCSVPRVALFLLQAVLSQECADHKSGNLLAEAQGVQLLGRALPRAGGVIKLVLHVPQLAFQFVAPHHRGMIGGVP